MISLSAMDEFLNKAGSQAVSFAIKSGISFASSFAIRKISKMMIQFPSEDVHKIAQLRDKLEDRIEIVSSAIDLIKLVAARGNTNLQSVLRLTKNLKNELDQFDQRITSFDENLQLNINDRKKQIIVIKDIEQYMVTLLQKIDEITPFINLSLTTSGANLNSSLPKQISPGLFLQASNAIIKTNEQVVSKDNRSIQVGPIFEMTLFTIFYNGKKDVPIIWKEEMKRADLQINRIYDPIENFRYEINITKNFDDERYHNLDEEVDEQITLNITDVKKLFFSVSGKLLNLEENSDPVLVLKTLKGRENDTSDEMPIWYALGGYEATEISSDDESDEDDEIKTQEDKVDKSSGAEKPESSTSVSLLEYILRLLSLQHMDQTDILSVNDERLSLYLNDENPIPKVEKQVNIEEVIHALKNMNL